MEKKFKGQNLHKNLHLKWTHANLRTIISIVTWFGLKLDVITVADLFMQKRCKQNNSTYTNKKSGNVEMHHSIRKNDDNIANDHRQ